MRIFSAAVCVLLATLLAPLVIGATWVKTHVDDTDRYVSTVAPLASDPALRKQLGDELGEAAAVALNQHVPVKLPDNVTDLIRNAADQVVKDPGFPEFWRKANRSAQQDFVDLMRNHDTPTGGWISVDMSPLLKQVFDKLGDKGVPVQLIPDVPLEVPVARKARLAQERGKYDAMETLAVVGPIAWLVLVGIAIAVAPGWRGRLRALGLAALGVALAAVLVMLASGPVTDFAADHAAEGRSGLVRLILDVTLHSLSPYARTFLLVAAPVGLVLLAVTLVPRRHEPAY